MTDKKLKNILSGIIEMLNERIQDARDAAHESRESGINIAAFNQDLGALDALTYFKEDLEEYIKMGNSD